jgi:hypothetical protein
MLNSSDTSPLARARTGGPDTSMRGIMDRVRSSHAARIGPEIDNPTPEQRASMPREIDCLGLTVHDLGEAFADEFQGRRLWCREHCRGVFAVEPLWSAAERRDIGRRFLFWHEADAAPFRHTWCECTPSKTTRQPHFEQVMSPRLSRACSTR